MTHSQPAAHRGFPLIFMVRYLRSMGVYEGHLRKLERVLPESINIADLYRRLQWITDGEGILRRALEAAPQDAGVHRALGLALVRLKRLDEALAELRLAADLAPDQARYAYVYAVALHSAGRGSEAMTALKISLARHPNDRDTRCPAA
jgi:tetratricopeptide (TPR) repeat protein